MPVRREFFDYSTAAPASFWRPILSEAESNIRQVYSATFFAKRHISVVDQQTRAFNLSFALSRAGSITSKTRIAIVGAGVSGMTCAVALAMLKGCHCALFDMDSILLRRFREAPFRFIHPDLNASTDSDAAVFDPARRTNFAFLNWTANPAPIFADELCRKFEHYRSSGPISLHLAREVTGVRIASGHPTLEFSDKALLEFDFVIVATGFGDERKSSFTNDASYWHSGNPSQYVPTALRGKKTSERILISGNGDSGILELAHFLIRDFRHSSILGLLPSNALGRGGSMGLMFAQRVEDMWFRRIESGNDEYPHADGPLSWYWWVREIRDTQPAVWRTLGAGVARKYLVRVSNVFDSKLGTRKIGAKVPPSTLARLEKLIGPILDELASVEIERLVNEFNLDKLLPPQMSGFFSNDFNITIVGPSPTIYSRRQAPQNWFLVYILKRYGSFQYRRVRFEKAESRPRGILVHFVGTKRTQSTDRIVVRQGANFASLGYEAMHAKVPKSQFRSTHLRNLASELDAAAPSYRDAFVTVFRTKRWKSAIAWKEKFEDEPNAISDFGSMGPMTRQLDSIFLHMRELGLSNDAYRFYRLAKQATTERKRAGVLARMLKLILKAHSEPST
jgi:hypothetical protein